jgi:hypothetical protein
MSQRDMSQHDQRRDLIRRLSESPEWVDALMGLCKAASDFSRVQDRVFRQVVWPQLREEIDRDDPQTNPDASIPVER